MKQSLRLQMGQSLQLTPQLLQSIRLLQMPALELEQAVTDALDRNVMLEPDDSDAGDDGESPELAAVEKVIAEADLEWDTAAETFGSAGPLENEEGFEARRAAPEPTDARGKVLAQLRLTLEGHELKIGEAVLDEIDDAGYLAAPLADVLQQVQALVPATPLQIISVLRQIQRFDPAGYGAADLRECLLIQLEVLGPNVPGRTLAMRLVKDHLLELASPDCDALAAKLATTAEQIQKAVRLVRSLSPKPGVAGSDQVAEAAVPDVIVRRVGKHWHVELANPATARIRVNGLYEQLLNRCKSDGHAQVLREQLQEARWLVRGLQMRNQTLLRTAKVLVERQRAFLERGEEGLKPLTLREVADAIGMHESTVSRITTQKYVQTPRGVFELKAFFSNALSDDARDGASGAAVRAMVRRLIENESPATPLADGVIARLLERNGVHIARRTVSKYREALQIPAARERGRDHPRQFVRGV